MLLKDEFFLTQYNQIWEQRRQHVGHIWAIPVVATGLAGIFATFMVNQNVNFSTHTNLKIAALCIVGFGFIGLFLRHNFFIKVLGLLLKDLAAEEKPKQNLPQFGSDFKKKYCCELNCLEKFGSCCTGTVWWFITTCGIIAFVVLNCI